MRRQLFFFLLTFALSTASQAKVSFEGALSDHVEKLKTQLKSRINQPTPKLADEIIQNLMGYGIYSSVQVLEDSDGNYIVEANILKILGGVEFVGMQSVDEIEALNAVGLKPGSRLDLGQIPDIESRLRELYGRSGFFSPDIDISTPDVEQPEVPLVIRITENSPCRIQEVKIISDNETLSRQMLNEIKRYQGRIFSEKNLLGMEEAARAFVRKKRLLNSRLLQKEASYNPEKTEAYLVYDLTNPFTYTVQTEGNSYYTTADLLRAANLDSFDQSSLNPAADIAERVRQKYVENGFADVKISFQESTNPERFTKLVKIDIVEGPRILISKFEVLGRLSRPPQFYGKFIRNNSTEAVKKSLYVVEGLELGYRNLLTDLNNQGYLRAKIQSTRTEFNKDRTRVVVQVLLDEGPLTQIKNIGFKGNNSYTETELLQILGLLPNTPLRLGQLENGIQKIKDHYRATGYIEMGIKNERSDLVTYDDKGYEATIRFEIQEGPQVRVREILVEGNTFTKDYVIIREMNIEPGEILTPEKIEEAQKRLDKLNIFSRVEVRTLEANTNVSQRALIVNVMERNPGSFRMGLGLTNKRQLTARGFGGISYSNLWGTARAVSLRLSAENNLVLDNYLEYQVIAGYLEPFLFNTKFRGRVNLSYDEKVEKYEESNKTSTIRATNKLSLLMERDITSKIRFTWNFWSIESVELFQDPATIAPFTPSETQISTIGPLLDIDYRDNPFLPTTGVFTRLEADYSSPRFGSSDNVEFVRTQATFTHYSQVGSPRWVWANSLRGGYGKNLSKLPDSGIPLSYAFFLGGYTTIRGYSGVEDDRIPSSSVLGATSGEQLVIPDETTYGLFKSELRYPIYGIVGGVLFYDAGRVDIKDIPAIENDPEPLKQGVGVGVRINTPVGPISFDYARKINPQAGESPDHFHLSIGTF